MIMILPCHRSNFEASEVGDRRSSWEIVMGAESDRVAGFGRLEDGLRQASVLRDIRREQVQKP
jgi:hypothetical protein